MFKKCCSVKPQRAPVEPPPKSHRVSCVEFDASCVEFDLAEYDEYCPTQCSICLSHILKVNAQAGPCVTHVFHANCINEWLAYRIMEDQQPSCPICLMEYKQCTQ